MTVSAKEIEAIKKDLHFVEPLVAIPFNWQTTWGLFSPKSIDDGTKLLLDYLEINENDNCLDLGCGYGPIGLYMAKKAKLGHATLVDKDFVAVEYAKKNAQLNNINNVSIYLSNGLNHLQTQGFDVVATNLPAKSNREHYLIYFYDAWQTLNQGGCLYVVCINGLRKFVARTLKDVFGDAKKLKQGKVYTVIKACNEL